MKFYIPVTILLLALLSGSLLQAAPVAQQEPSATLTLTVTPTPSIWFIFRPPYVSWTAEYPGSSKRADFEAVLALPTPTVTSHISPTPTPTEDTVWFHGYVTREETPVPYYPVYSSFFRPCLYGFGSTRTNAFGFYSLSTRLPHDQMESLYVMPKGSICGPDSKYVVIPPYAYFFHCSGCGSAEVETDFILVRKKTVYLQLIMVSETASGAANKDTDGPEG